MYVTGKSDEPCECTKCQRETHGRGTRSCCDVCDHSLVLTTTKFLPPPAKPPRKRKIKAQEITADNMDATDRLLKKALRKWAAEELQKRYPGEEFYGPQLIMSERVLHRIIDLAHESKIPNATVLTEQLQWSDAPRYADQVFEIIRTIYPTNPPVETPFTVLSTNGPLSQVSPYASNSHSTHPPLSSQGSLSADKENHGVETAARRRQCSKCKAHGHIGKCFTAYITF